LYYEKGGDTLELYVLPFIIEAMGYNKNIYPDIDRLYQTRKYEFYKAAREHELYTHQIVTEGGLLQEEYCKKALGILLCADADEGICQELNAIFRKGWTYAYLFVENHQEVDLSKFMRNFIRKAGRIDAVSDDYINTNLFMCFYFAASIGRKIIEDKMYKELLEILSTRMKHYQDWYNRISLNTASQADLMKVKDLKGKIFARYGTIRDMNTLISALGKQTEQAALLYDYERLSILSIIDGLPFGDTDIEEILLAYVATHEKYTVEDAVNYLIFATYIKYMTKTYKDVKFRYFENNKETMYIELEGLERELLSSKQEIARLSGDLSNALKSLATLERENTRLKNELEDERKGRQELISLREFLFKLNRQEEYAVQSETVNREVLKGLKAVVIGGHEKWQARMKELLPSFIFIHPDNKSFDLRLLDGIKIIFIYVNYLNHAIYNRVMGNIRDKGIKIVYLNQQNEGQVLSEIMKVVDEV